MASSREFAEFVVESLQPLGPVVARPMFGGFGIYLDDVMFALIAYDTLYFKVDDGNRQAYEDAAFPTSSTPTRENRSACLTARRRARASTTPRCCATGRAQPTPPRCGPRSRSGGDVRAPR